MSKLSHATLYKGALPSNRNMAKAQIAVAVVGSTATGRSHPSVVKSENISIDETRSRSAGDANFYGRLWELLKPSAIHRHLILLSIDKPLNFACPVFVL
jgi:hypothetical protein